MTQIPPGLDMAMQYESLRKRYGDEKAKEFLAGARGMTHSLTKNADELTAKAQHLMGWSQFGNTYMKPTTTAFGWGLLMLFIIGPALLIILTMFGSFPWWIWAGIMFIIIYTMVKPKRGAR